MNAFRSELTLGQALMSGWFHRLFGVVGRLGRSEGVRIGRVPWRARAVLAN